MNYTIHNNMEIPLRLEKLHMNTELFQKHDYDAGKYIFPLRSVNEFVMQYKGSKELVVSPMMYAAVAEFNGGLLVPYIMSITDNTLICVYQGREDRCSKLKVINFGHQKSIDKNQVQIMTIKNLNPT